MNTWYEAELRAYEPAGGPVRMVVGVQAGNPKIIAAALREAADELDPYLPVMTPAEPGDDGDEPACDGVDEQFRADVEAFADANDGTLRRLTDAPLVVSVPVQAAVVALDALERMDSLEDDELCAKGCEAAWAAINGAVNVQMPLPTSTSREQKPEPAPIVEPEPQTAPVREM